MSSEATQQNAPTWIDVEDMLLIAQEVHLWSIENFGDQKGIDKLAPLLGIGEELGELAAASNSEEFGEETERLREQADAIGDIGIYLFDFCTRDEVDLEGILWSIDKSIPDNPALAFHSFDRCLSSLISDLGHLHHAVLKRHQGIRGYDDINVYVSNRDTAIGSLLANLYQISVTALYPFEVNNFELIVEETWEKVVSKRNWKSPLRDNDSVE